MCKISLIFQSVTVWQPDIKQHQIHGFNGHAQTFLNAARHEGFVTQSVADNLHHGAHEPLIVHHKHSGHQSDSSRVGCASSVSVLQIIAVYMP